MQDDDTFRIALIVGVGFVLPVGVYRRLKSQASKERLDRREEGLFILVTLRPISAAGMIGLLAYVIDPAWMAWSSVPLPAFLRGCGVGLGVVAAALLMAAFRSLGTNLTDTVVTRRHHMLVTTGPYRLVRHPSYVACFLAVIANSIVAANWFIALTGTAAAALLVVRTAKEEQKLADRFGADYFKYVERTGRFLPRLKR